jgi:RecA-family ATPase
MEANYLYQSIDFSKLVIRLEDWKTLHKTIADSEAEVVFIDSITRMNHGNLEDSVTAEKIMVRLRTIAQDLNITLFAIHHTPKMFGKPIGIDSIKGSSTFAQEADFAIGINRTDKSYRYMKNVFFRYASDDDEFVKEFITPESTWLQYIDEVDENDIIQRSDRRRKDDKRDDIVNCFDNNPQTTYTCTEAVNFVMNLVGVKKRQAQTYLSEITQSNRIQCLDGGIYCSVNYVAPNDEVNNG